MATKKAVPSSGPGVVVNISGGDVWVPAMPSRAVGSHGELVCAGEEVAVSDVAGFDSINWKVKAV